MIGTNTINGNATTGIDLDNGGGSLTINVPLVVANAQNWYNNSGNPITINGGITGGATITLTKLGTGAISLAAPVDSMGYVDAYGGTLQVTGGSFSIAQNLNADAVGAVFAQSGGTVSGGGSLFFGIASQGFYSLSGGMLSFGSGNEYLGSNNGSSGTFANRAARTQRQALCIWASTLAQAARTASAADRSPRQ